MSGSATAIAGEVPRFRQFDAVTASDKQTDRRFAMVNTALCVASSATRCKNEGTNIINSNRSIHYSSHSAATTATVAVNVAEAAASIGCCNRSIYGYKVA